MKKLHIRFELDKKLKDIDVIVRANEKDAQVEATMEKLENRAPQKLTLLDNDGCQNVINEKDIITVSSDGKQVRVITSKGVYTAKQTLQGIEELLNDRLFLRISRFEIVNLRKIRKYDFTVIGTLRIEFEKGMETWASRRFIPVIKKKLLEEEGYLC